MSRPLAIRVPDVLGGPAERMEEFFELLAVVGRRPIILDLAASRWICPYGVVMLVGTCRYLAQASGQPVQLVGLYDAVHAYLRRLDFFERTVEVAFTEDAFDATHELGRSAASTNVLELVPIGQAGDVYEMANRARRILSYWLGGSTDDTGRVVSLLAEACNNIVDHSGDTGAVTIQKYERGGGVDIELAICDMGIGIRRSLARLHSGAADSPAGFIELALGGLSAREGRGGQGLGAMQRITTASGGRLFIRSETGSVAVGPGGMVSADGLAFFPGTQVAITFRSH